MDNLGWREPPFCLTHLAQRMSCHIPCSYLFPSSAVTFVGLRITFVLLVTFPRKCSMLFAVGVVRQVRTTRILTGFSWFHWHLVALLSVQSKSPRRFLHEGLVVYIILILPFYHPELITQCVIDSHELSRCVNFQFGVGKCFNALAWMR